ncbi:MAG TPA: hypothetical protein VNE59_01840 [Burkholderiales bacterium]|nr:hypothetical protein [Burkholderiales bacterium]
MIIDAVMFLNEVELFEFRYELLKDSVDCFVVVEADTTHSGRKRNLVFPDLLNRRKDIASRTIYHPRMIDTAGMKLDFVPGRTDLSTDHWKIENLIRNAIAEPLETIDDDELLLISDVDEIPSREAIRALAAASRESPPLPIAFQQALFYYNLRFLRNESWRGTVMTTVGMARARSPQWHRDTRNQFPCAENAGWHLSYFGGTEKVRNKIESMAHQEFNLPPHKGTDHIDRCRRSGLDLFGRKADATEVGRDFFPSYFLQAADKNSGFFFD